ncbi:hypothetical protein K470DRAFT_43554 [Piedraia hortae CBS 480.64]|uniref:Uncharacterized protein n=1 Tax=Piedraia hortae CBS 480.64 TaxID=1314780 RepID=A0A6A7C0U2_9PEZI|nr:hypothetical protein K470DRAFT_43554 [Piedraia hortae CBS 480.64]
MCRSLALSISSPIFLGYQLRSRASDSPAKRLISAKRLLRWSEEMNRVLGYERVQDRAMECKNSSFNGRAWRR